MSEQGQANDGRPTTVQSFLSDIGESKFHNIEARTRKVRRDRESKETLEKSRLEQRRECHFKYENLGKITEMDPGSLGYATNSDRFQTDTSGEEYLGRQTAIHTRKAMLDAKRAALIEREEARWQQIERAQEAERSKWDRIRNEGARNRTNVNSVPYNPVTLRYNDNKEGDDLRKSDNLVRVRAAQRAKILHDRGNSGFNPITGSLAAEVVVPKLG
eukprot:g1358.t1